MPRPIEVDLLVVGGGVAGLWCAAKAGAGGWRCAVVERAALGAGQTAASQGIIHGGIKYALGGFAGASRAIAEMPATWRACLAGRGEVDLTRVRVLSDRQFLWTTGGIGSRLAALAASRLVRTEVRPVAAEERPEGLRGAGRGVAVYSVDEPVLEARSVVESLARAAEANGGVVTRADVRRFRRDEPSGRWVADLAPARGEDRAGEEERVLAGGVVLAAGEGNAALAGMVAGSEHGEGLMQRRPLHMIMARGTLPALFGHCVGASDKPRLTITTHANLAGRRVWYIGGQVAEAGVEREQDEQVGAAKREVAACLPWVDLAGVEWATFRVDRAEGLTERGRRPDGPVVRTLAPGAAAVWPTKLALAPAAAALALRAVGLDGPGPGSAATPIENPGPGPRLACAAPPWEEEAVRWT
jgi:glycerol-3-phosphate dehydrogenase